MYIRGEDEDLRRLLTQDEQIVRQSTDKMQRELDTLKVSVKDTGTAGANAGQMFSAFGAEVSAVGGKVGEVGGKVASLGGAFTALGPAILGPAGAVLALSAGLSLLIGNLMRSREEAEAFAEAIKESARAARELTQESEKAATSAERRATALIAELRGPEAVIEERARVAMEDLANREAALRRQIVAVDTPRYEAIQAELAAISDLRIAITEDTARKLEQIEDDRRKRQLSEEKAHQAKLTAEAKQRAAEQQAAFQKTGAGRIFGAALAMVQERRQMAEMREILDSPLFRMIPGIRDDLARRVGLLKAPQMQIGGPGRARGIEAGVFRGGVTTGAVAVQDDKRDEKKRTEDVGEMRSLLERILPTLASAGGVQ